jgi:MFS family permease
MMQDMFNRTALQAATVVSLISIFNAAGRFFWATVSDYIGRRTTFMVFLLAQTALFLLIPRFGAAGEWLLFESALFLVFSMYGGGFGTMPAFAADMFGPANVGGIYGVMLTAWSAAAVVGPLIITQLSSVARASLKPGAPKVHIYDQPLAVLAGFLAFGFILCLLIRPLKSRLAKA